MPRRSRSLNTLFAESLGQLGSATHLNKNASATPPTQRGEVNELSLQPVALVPSPPEQGWETFAKHAAIEVYSG